MFIEKNNPRKRPQTAQGSGRIMYAKLVTMMMTKKMMMRMIMMRGDDVEDDDVEDDGVQDNCFEDDNAETAVRKKMILLMLRKMRWR